MQGTLDRASTLTVASEESAQSMLFSLLAGGVVPVFLPTVKALPAAVTKFLQSLNTNNKGQVQAVVNDTSIDSVPRVA